MSYDNALSNVVQTINDLPQIVDNLLLLLSEKEKTVIVKRFNLNNIRKYTLEEIGQEFSVTRERVRQVEKNALAKMRRNVFNTTLKFLHDFVSSLMRDHGGVLRENSVHADLGRSLATPIDENKVHFALALHENLECEGNSVNFYPHLRDRTISEYILKHVSNQLVNQMYKYGDVKELSKINVDLKSILDDAGFDQIKLKSLIEIDKRLTLLDNDLVGLMEWRHINPRTLRDKILFVLRNEKKPMHFTEIAGRISKANFDTRQVNLQAVHNELIRHSNFVLIGRGIYALEEWGYEKGTVSDVIGSILTGQNELSQEEIIDLVLKQRKVKKITIVLALKNSQKFERIGRRQYRLKFA